MTHYTRFGAISVAAMLTSTSVLAEGLERATFSSNYLYEEGTFVSLSFGQVEPDFSATDGSGTFSTSESVAEDFFVTTLRFKADLSEKVSVGFLATNGTNGVDIQFFDKFDTPPGVLTAPQGSVSATEFQVLGLYQASENISVFGGVKYVEAEGTVNLGDIIDGAFMPGTDGVADQFDTESDSGFGYIIGAAYEIPEIALRVALSYESEIDLSLPTTLNGVDVGDSDASIGDALQLEFQTGVAENTLVFGKIRYAMWDDNQVVIPVAGQISTFEDSTSYSLGVARRFSESFAASVSAFYEPGDGDGASPLAPQGETKSLSVGGRYTFQSGISLSGGVSYSWR
ncbi:MAG: hypothetical protein AAGA63_02980, partial [Pseudomonadota bacterium]